MTVVTIGVDPGGNGAISTLVDGELFDVVDMPTFTVVVNKRKRKVVDALEVHSAYVEALAHCDHKTTPTVVIEHTWGRGDTATTAFGMGRSFEAVFAAASILGWTTTLLTPQAWQKAVGLPSGHTKGDSVALADATWPERTHLFRGSRGGEKDGRAEAALIARAGDLLRADRRAA